MRWQILQAKRGTTLKKHINIAIDGPSGAGKSTISRAVAAKLGIIYVDTGAMYRSVGLYVKRAGIDPTDREKVKARLDEINVTITYGDGQQHIFLNGEDVSEAIRQNEISMYASHVSAIPEVRSHLLALQRQLARSNSVIMDGRDIGTVILPDADLKVYITATAENRAKRRYDELVEKGQNVTYDEVLNDMIKRDKNDSSRDIAPAVAADDAVIFDNTGYRLEQSVDYIMNLIARRFSDEEL